MFNIDIVFHNIFQLVLLYKVATLKSVYISYLCCVLQFVNYFSALLHQLLFYLHLLNTALFYILYHGIIEYYNFLI